MSKAEYRYYELPQNLPLLALTGEKWETVYGMDNMHFHNYLEVGYCYYGNGIIQFAEKVLPYHAGTLTFIPKNMRKCRKRTIIHMLRFRLLLISFCFLSV